jgi:hypothetical protein
MYKVLKTQTKYSGINVKDIIYLLNTGLINYEKRKTLMFELLHRYFNKGRQFNLYSSMISLSDNDKYMYFAQAMSYELQSKITNIPIEHTEAFIKVLLSFIKHIGMTVLRNKELSMEWTIHEFYGIKDMLEKIKEAKISDLQLRQDINLFIDRINKAREETLNEIKKNEQSKNELMVVGKQELMKEKLQRLNIPLSKANKTQLFAIIENIDIYYEKDRIKIIKRAFNKYKDSFIYDFPVLAFKYNIENKDENTNMKYLMLGHKVDQKNITKLTGDSSESSLYDYYMNWLNQIKNKNDNIINAFKCNLSKKYNKKEYNNWLWHFFNRYYDHLKKYIEAESVTLTELLKGDKVKVENYDDLYDIYCENGEWKFRRNNRCTYEERMKSPLALYFQIFKLTKNKLFDYRGYDLKDNSFKALRNDPGNELHKFATFFDRVIIDPAAVKHLMTNNENSYRSYNDYTDNQAVSLLLQNRFNRNVVTLDEIKTIFKDNPNFLYEFVVRGVYEGFFKEEIEYIGSKFIELLSLYDFTDEQDLSSFFKLKFDGDSFYGRYAEHDKFSKELAEELIKKLEKEVPYEMLLIKELLQFQEEEHKIVETYDLYSGLSELTKAILRKENIEIEEVHYEEGIRVEIKGRKMVLSSKEVQNYEIIKYFKNKFKD